MVVRHCSRSHFIGQCGHWSVWCIVRVIATNSSFIFLVACARVPLKWVLLCLYALPHLARTKSLPFSASMCRPILRRFLCLHPSTFTSASCTPFSFPVFTHFALFLYVGKLGPRRWPLRPAVVWMFLLHVMNQHFVVILFAAYEALVSGWLLQFSRVILTPIGLLHALVSGAPCYALHMLTPWAFYCFLILVNILTRIRSLVNDVVFFWLSLLSVCFASTCLFSLPYDECFLQHQRYFSLTLSAFSPSPYSF
ncbi:unnamed protein product [Trypanosoma congolense IL3000]|uniref:WGS project CAEQ00000000 data, annotated contig 1411 n=1 Tax=Trypanosoma congolense (strain IL3000) TaxID=1068625 RepID=F9W613_TRYCI|nr:unnamed protein product [Trypanosoma congolense IL3000]